MKSRILTSIIVALMTISAPMAALAGPLTPPTFVVDPGLYRYWRFEISGSARVFGQFSVQAPAASEIQVFVVDESDFENFRNGRQVKSYYYSGRVNEGRIDIRLGYGRYVLIFDNGFSPYSGKTIRSTLQLQEE